MKSKVYYPGIDEALDSVPIEHGGTAARTKETACKNLGLVSKDQVRQPDGILILGEDGLIKKSDLPPDVLNNELPSLFGPQDVELGTTVPYYITNYASDVVYDVSVGGGTFTRDVDCIFFTAQDASAQGYIQVNARNFPLWIGPPKPMRPVVLTPEEGVEQGPFAKFTSSDFIGRKSGDLHASSEWQVSDTIGFDTIVATGVVTEAGQLKAWTSTRLKRNTAYFARVRYTGSLGGASEWSVPHAFRTRISFIPEYYMASIGEEDYGYAKRLRSVDIDSAGDRVILGDPTVDEDPNYDIGAIRVFRRVGESFVEEAVMVDNPLSLNTEIRLTIPVGGRVEMVTDSETTGNQVFTASAVLYAPTDASYVTFVGKGANAVETQTPKPQQGLPEYPEGLPAYSPGQMLIEATGDRYYPEGLLSYVPLQAGGLPEYPDGLPPFDWQTDTGLEDYPDGLPPYNPAFPRIAQVGSPDYPNGLPPYDEGQPYIAPTGNPAFPNGLPPYEPAGLVFTPGEAASVSYNGQSYTFPGGTDGLAKNTTVTLNFLSNQTEHNFGKEVSLSKDGLVTAASGNTFVWKGIAADLRIPPGGQIEFNMYSPTPFLETYYQDERVSIPRDAYQIDITGKGAPGAPGTIVPGSSSMLSTSGNVTIPKGIRSITATGKGGAGSVILSPQVGLPEYPDGLPVYNAGQAYVADVGLAAYPNGLPVYNAGQPYVAPSGWVEGTAGTPATYAWENTASWAGDTTVPTGSAAPGPTASIFTYSPPTALGQTVTRYEKYPDTVTVGGVVYDKYGKYIYDSVVKTAAVPGTSGYYQYPGQSYIAPTGNPSYPSGLPKYVAGQPYIAPTGNPAYPNGLPPYEPPGTPQIGLPEYPDGLPPYNASQAYIAPTGSSSYPSGLAPYDPGQPYIAPTASSYAWNTSSAYASTTASAAYAYTTIGQVTSSFGTPTASGQTKSGGYSVQESGTYYNQYSVTATSYQATAYNAGQPYIAPTYQWIQSGTDSVTGTTPYTTAELDAIGPNGGVFGASTGSLSTPPTAAGQTMKITSTSAQGILQDSRMYLVSEVTYYTSAIKTAGQAYIAPTAATYAWGSPTITQTASGVTSNSYSVVAAAGDAMSTAGTPTAAGQTFSRNVATSYSDTKYKNYTVSATSYVFSAGSAGQPYIAPSGNPSYPSGLPPYNAGQPYIAPTGNPSYPSGLPAYSPAGTTNVMGPDTTFTINGKSYIFPGGKGTNPAVEKAYTISLPGTTAMDGVFTIASGGFGKVVYEDGVIPNRTVAPLNTTVTRDGSIGISRAITTLTLRGKGQDGTSTTVTPQQGLPEYPDGLPVYNAGQPYIAPAGLPEYPNGLPPYNAGQAYVAPTGNPSYPNGLPPYRAGQAYIAPTGSSSYPNGLPPYNPGQPYIEPTSAVYGWNTTETLSSTTVAPQYIYNLLSQVISSFGTPTANGQTKSGGYSVQQAATLYNQYTVTAVAYQATAYNAGQPYVAATYQWTQTSTDRRDTQYTIDQVEPYIQNGTYPNALNAFGASTGSLSTPPTAAGQTMKITSAGSSDVSESSDVIVSSFVTYYTATQKTAAQPYVAPTAATYAWDTPSVTQTATDLTSTALPVVTGVSDAMSTAGTPTYTGQTFSRNVATSYSGATYKNYTVSGTSYTVTEATLGQAYIAPTGNSSYPNGLPAYNPGQQYIAPTGNPSYPSGLPVYNAGQPYVAPSGNINYPSGLPAYTTGQQYIAPVGNSSYPSGLPTYKPAVITTTNGQNTTFTINGQTYTFQGGQNGASAVSRLETVTLPATVDQTGVYTVPTGGSIEISHYGGTLTGNEVVALDMDIANTGYLTFESGLASLTVTLKGGDGDIVIVEPEQGLPQFPNGLPRYVPGSTPQVGDPSYPNGLPVYRQAVGKRVKGEDSTFTINGQTFIFEGGNGVPAIERTEVIPLPGSTTLTATYHVAENVTGTVQHDAYEVWISAGYPSVARINNTIYVFPGGESGEATPVSYNVPLVGSMNVGSVSTTFRTGESWSPPMVLTPEVDQEHLHFGTSISLDGTGLRMAISAVGYDTAKGAVWLYVREGAYWKREAFFSPKELEGSNHFGTQVILSQDGQTLAIGAPYHQQKGAVWLYQRIQDKWYFQAKLMPEDLNRDDNFGVAVGLSADGKLLAVGSPGRSYEEPYYEWDPVTETRTITYFEQRYNAGAVFTFQQVNGKWVQTEELHRVTDPSVYTSRTNNRFGASLSMDAAGSALVIGLPGSDNGYGGYGMISTFIGQDGGWSFYKEVEAVSNSMSMQFSKELRIAASGQYMVSNANGSHFVDGQYLHAAAQVFSVEERTVTAPPGGPFTQS